MTTRTTTTTLIAALALLAATAPGCHGTFKLAHHDELDVADFSAYDNVASAHSVKVDRQDVLDETKKMKLEDGDVLNLESTTTYGDNGEFTSMVFAGKSSDAYAEITVMTDASSINGVIVDQDGGTWAVVDYTHSKGELAILEIGGSTGGGGSDDGPFWDDNDDWLQTSDVDGASGRSFELANRLRNRDVREALQRAEDEPNTESVVSIKFYYAPDIASGIVDDILHIMDVTRAGFENSGVLIDLQLLCAEQWAFSGNQDDLDALDTNGDLIEAFFDSFGRDEEDLLDSADVAVLLVQGPDDSDNDGDKVSSIAYLDNTERAFGVVRLDNALYHYGVGRVLGHIFGAVTNDEALGANDPVPYSYGKGYRISNKKCTIMGEMEKTRVNFYSGSSTVDDDGDATGDADADNVRLFNERRFVYGLVGDESTCVLDSAYTVTTTEAPATTAGSCPADVDAAETCVVRSGLGYCAEDDALFDMMSDRCCDTCAAA